jgi:hypothetical protein
MDEQAATSPVIKEVVGVFHDEAALMAAADQLMISGFDRADINLLAAHEAVERRLGHVYERVIEFEDKPAVAARAYAGTDSRTEGQAALVGGLMYVGAAAAAGLIVASGGTLAVVLAGVAIAGGTGGLLGTALSRWIDRRHAEYVQHHLDHGGLLLWVRLSDDAHEQRALEILRRHAAEDVHVVSLREPTPAAGGGVSRDLSFMRLLGM